MLRLIRESQDWELGCGRVVVVCVWVSGCACLSPLLSFSAKQNFLCPLGPCALLTWSVLFSLGLFVTPGAPSHFRIKEMKDKRKRVQHETHRQSSLHLQFFQTPKL